jgi:hypothetical protein
MQRDCANQPALTTECHALKKRVPVVSVLTAHIVNLLMLSNMLAQKKAAQVAK